MPAPSATDLARMLPALPLALPLAQPNGACRVGDRLVAYGLGNSAVFGAVRAVINDLAKMLEANWHLLEFAANPEGGGWAAVFAFRPHCIQPHKTPVWPNDGESPVEAISREIERLVAQYEAQRLREANSQVHRAWT